MTPESIIDLFQGSIYVAVKLIAVIIMPGLIVGLIVSVLQAATQINEQTLSFLPRLITTLFTLIIIAPWLLSVMLDFCQRLMTDIPMTIG